MESCEAYHNPLKNKCKRDLKKSLSSKIKTVCQISSQHWLDMGESELVTPFDLYRCDP